MTDEHADTGGGTWRVRLPQGAEPPYRVFINGVPQEHGSDYELYEHTLHFSRPLAKEGKLGFWRWLSMFLAIAGTYRKHDSVDVQYRLAGRERVAVGLDIIPPESPPGDGD
ncbi:MAG: hypothetical protein WD649_01720 [Thermoleophilaceae bacterium]